jgi:tetratricopeptide (TPR) repeat protein
LKQAHTEKSIATYTKSLAICYQGLAFALKNLNQFPQSEQALITVLDMEKRDPPFKLDPDDKAETYSQLGMLYFDWMKQTRNNPNLLNKSLNSMNLAVQSVQGSNESRYRSFLGNSLIHRGDMERQEGLLAKAEQDYKDAINAAPHDSHVVQLAQQRLNEMFNKVIDEILK